MAADNTIVEFCAALRSLKSVIVTSHFSPDADAIGSSAAMVHVLKDLGMEVTWYLQDPIPRRMLPFVQGLPVVHEVPGTKADAVFGLDSATLSRIGDSAPLLLQQGNKSFNADHHISNDHWADFNLVVPQSASTAEIVLNMAEVLGVALRPEVAGLLLCGLMEDTGSFRFSNTTPESFQNASRLVQLGARPREIAQELFFSIPPSMIRLRAEVLGGIRVFGDSRVAIAVVTEEMLKRCGAESEDTEGLVDEARSIQGTIAAILMKQKAGIWKLSFRSKDDRLDVSALAATFGGGGHKAASGCRMTGSREAVEQTVEKAFLDALSALS